MRLQAYGIVAVSKYREVGVVLLTPGGWSCKDWPFGMLEPYDGKLSRTVLRGLGDGNIPRLPDEW
ncbi:hypothetical protein DSCOOX_17690 [Desulfosarcina ovata subsp. ovata]|uniref:Uncharacterized protein n=1 Tax=Desulfosarcina ovata subsp. ovata TaxID=2752305 RepID=A0A5K8A7X2_9BACT|nr:hypothetical protein DSCOOX_17690 [Desulfosarcina ovata subsp. ovata]